MAHPNLTTDPELIKIKTMDDGSKEFNEKEKMSLKEKFWNLSKLEMIAAERFLKSLNLKKIYSTISEVLIGSSYFIVLSTLSVVNPSIGIFRL